MGSGSPIYWDFNHTTVNSFTFQLQEETNMETKCTYFYKNGRKLKKKSCIQFSIMTINSYLFKKI